VRVALILLSFALPVLCQETPQTSKPPCIAADESIYGNGGDVKPPQWQPDKNEKSEPDIQGSISMTLVLLVNSEGRICETRIVNAVDRLSAQKAANFMLEHLTFKPATRQGKPVAVRVSLTIDSLFPVTLLLPRVLAPK
jgi:hypothetical protein